MRTIDELVDTPDPAWPELQAELTAAQVPLDVLDIDEEAGRRCLHHLQVTTRSRLGALALHTGGLLVEHGWLRVLGGGSPAQELPSLADANGLSDKLAQIEKRTQGEPVALGMPTRPADL